MITPPTDALEQTAAFLAAHLGHRLAVYERPGDDAVHYTLAGFDPETDEAYSRRPAHLSDVPHAQGPAHSLRDVFAAAAQLTCTRCHASRDHAPTS